MRVGGDQALKAVRGSGEQHAPPVHAAAPPVTPQLRSDGVNNGHSHQRLIDRRADARRLALVWEPLRELRNAVRVSGTVRP
jgi:hypothetical protein